MGQTKGNTLLGGIDQLPTLNAGQSDVLSQILQMIQGNQQAASEGFKQFLPGGGGGQAITEQANRNFEQKTLPSIFNNFGSGSKGSSALNQALAAGASNLNSDLASQLSQMQLQASQGLSNQAQGQTAQGLGTSPYAYSPTQRPFWQDAAIAGIGTTADIAKGLIKR